MNMTYEWKSYDETGVIMRRIEEDLELRLICSKSYTGSLSSYSYEERTYFIGKKSQILSLTHYPDHQWRGNDGVGLLIIGAPKRCLSTLEAMATDSTLAHLNVKMNVP